MSKESNKYEGRKIVLILGAGCTRSQKTGGNKPPLDGNFFRESRRTNRRNRRDIEMIQKYFNLHYKLDICDRNQGYDSLEYVMVKLFADSNDLSMREAAYKNFRSLIKLFNRRLANTTNEIKPSARSKLFKLIVGFLNEGAKPEDISIITFNQDIQIEKTLDCIENHKDYKKYWPLLNFPHCYQIDFTDTTSPKSSTNIFKKGDQHRTELQY